MPAQIFGAQAAVTTLNRAFTNSSPANAVYANQVVNAGADVSAANAGNVLAYGTFANTFAAPYQSMAFADIATLLLTNMGITGDAQAQTFVVAFLTQMGKPNLGMSVLLLSAYLSSLEGDATYSTAAKAWNAELTSGFSYSSNASNTTPQIGDVVAPPATQGQTFTLTTGVDTVPGSVNDDTINGTHLTFTAADTVAGSTGNDTLNLIDTGTAAWTVPAANVSSIETVNVRNLNGSTGTAAVAGTTEVTTITFQAINANKTVIIDGRTITAGASGATAAEVATAFISGTAAGGVATVVGALSTTTAAAVAGNSNVVAFTDATGTRNATDIQVSGTALTATPAVSQVSTVTVNTATTAPTDTISFTYNGVTVNAGAAGASTITAATAIANAINGYAGQTIAATGGTSTVTITSPVVVSLAGFAGTGAAFSPVGLTTPFAAAVAATPPSVSIVQGTNAVAAVPSASATDTIDANGFVGATAINSDQGTGALTITNLATGASAGINGNGSVSYGALSFGYKTASDAATLNISNGTKGAGAITVTSAPTAATINSTGAANTVGAINLGGADTALTVNAATNLTTGNITGFTGAAAKITVTGAAAAVNLATLQAAVTIVDASAMTAGGVKATTGGTMSSIKGGAGTDTVTIGAAVASAATIDLGAGNDALLNTSGVAFSTTVVADGGAGTDTIAASLINVGSASNIKNFEVLDVTGFNAPLDAQLLTASTIAGLAFTGVAAGTGNTAVIQNVANAATLSVTGAIDQALVTTNTLGSLTLTQTGTAPTLAVTFNAAPTAASVAAGHFASVGTLTLTGETALTVNSTGGTFLAGNGISTIQTTGNTLATVTITGDKAFTVGDVNTNTAATLTATTASSLTLIDGSAATGKLTITAGANDTITGQQLTYTGLTIKGGSAVDTITIAAKNGIVDAGAGNDVITVQANVAGTTSDVVSVTGGAGADTLVSQLTYIATASASSSNTTGNLVFFADAAAGDSLKFGTVANAGGALGAKANVAAAATFDQAVFIAESGVANTVSWFQYAGNTYVQNSGATIGANNSTDNIVIKLTGLVDLSAASVVTGANGTITLA